MAYGLVQDTTLQGMADALRSKGLAPETREEAIYVYGQHINTPTHPDDEVDVIPAFEAFTTKVTPVPEATKFIIRISKLRTTLGSTAFLGYLNIYENGNIIPCDYVYAGNYKNILVSTAGVENVEVQLKSSSDGGFSATIEVLAVDSDGNYIEGGDMPYQITVTNTLTPDGMVDAINNAPDMIPEEAFTITGNCSYRFANGGWDWFIEQYGNRVTTKDITNCNNMINSAGVSEIPFVINIKDCSSFDSMLFDAKLTKCPKIRGKIRWGTSTNFNNSLYCSYIRDAEDFLTTEMMQGFSTVKVTGSYSAPKPVNFSLMYSLRAIPSWFYEQRLNPESTAYPSYSYTLYYYLFNYCSSLGEMRDIPVWVCASASTSNMFSSTFNNCSRAKSITFETNNDGSPIVAQWKSQVIDLTSVGFGSAGNITKYNSGLTNDTQVKDDATYHALEDDPDWWTEDSRYSRYNHASAVETINSLPDTSAYLASAGGTNTIRFKGSAGVYTDVYTGGGAINALTEEEIAVAAAKGWTVTFSS